MLDKKLSALLLAIMMIVSVTVLAVPALSEDDEGDKGKDSEDRKDDDKRSDKSNDKGKNDDDKGSDDNSKDDKSGRRAEVTVAKSKERIEYEIEIEDDMMKLKVEVRNLDDGEDRIAIECSGIPSNAQNPILEGVLEVNNNRGELEIRDNIVTGEYKDCILYIGERSFSINDFRAVAGEQERKRGDKGLEIKVEIIDSIAVIKIEDEFKTDIIDRGAIADMILARLNFTSDDVSSILKVERVNESDDVSRDNIRTKVHVRDGIAEIDFKYRFVTNQTDIDSIIDVITNRISEIDRDLLIKSMDARVLNKADVKSTVERVKTKIIDDALLRNIDRLDRVVGNDRAIVSLRLTLQPENDTRSFGTADMLLIKSNNRDIGRISVTIITAEEADNLVACYNGESIGRLDVRATDEGFRIGTLKTFIDNIAISIPGVEISIADNCTSEPLLTGNL